MKRVFVFLFSCIFCGLSIAKDVPESFVYRYKPTENINLEIIERVNLHYFPKLVQEEIQSGEIKVFDHNKKPSIKFVYGDIIPGDKVLLNKEEVFELTISRQSYKDKIAKIKSIFACLLKKRKQFVPFVGIRQHDGSKYYGLIEKEKIDILTPINNDFSVTKNEILNYSKNNKLTIIYVFCPKDRRNACKITIKHKGKWLKDLNANIKIYSALALAERENFDRGKGLRFIANGDTPQGIYGIWASMYSNNPNFGCVPRVDVDLNTTPINGYNYNMFSFLLDELVPSSALEDYWINELPLAYAMGRSLLRIHANPINGADKIAYYQPPNSKNKYAPSSGCLNLGIEMEDFFDTLVKLDIFSNRYSNLNCEQNDNKIYWDASNAFGKVFLIVKDI